jgi:hypothetical protein
MINDMMTINDVVRLWTESKYKDLWIQSHPVVNHLGEIVCGTAIYHKGETITFGKLYKVEDYLLYMYRNSIFVFEEVRNPDETWAMPVFKEISIYKRGK